MKEMNSVDDQMSTIIRLKEIIRDRDSDIEKAATIGKQLLEDKEKLIEKLNDLLLENERLKQDKYSLKIDLEAQVQTVNTQSSELTLQREDYDNLLQKFQALQKENIQQKQTISNIMNEKHDLEKSVEEMMNENLLLNKKITLQEQSLQNRAELFVNMSIMDDTKYDEFDIDYYKMQNVHLQETMCSLQYELENCKLEESRLSVLVAKLEEDVAERDKELKSYSVEMQKARDVASELQGEIEILKLEQVDVNRRGNSVFGELDDRRKLVEKEYKLLGHKYQNMMKNYENNQRELSRCKGQMSILLSMTSRHYQDVYIAKLEDQLGAAKREIENLTDRLNKCLRQQRETNDHLAFKNDDYDYLRVMCQKAEDKYKILENDMMTVRLQNISLNDSLISTRRSLYATQEEMDAMKLENMKLKGQIRELTAKPDDEVAVKQEPKIEYLPWYKPPNSEANTETVSHDLNKTNGCENKESKTAESSKAGLKSDENSLMGAKLALKAWNKPIQDGSKNGKQNNETRFAFYKERYRSNAQRNGNNDDCRQQ